MQRNRAVTALALGLTIVLTAGLMATVHQAQVGERRLHDVRKLARSLLLEYDQELLRLPGSLPLRQRTLAGALQYFDGLEPDARNNPALQREVAMGYARAGEVSKSMGDTSQALTSLTKAVRLREAASSQPDADAWHEIGGLRRLLGLAHWEAGNVAGARLHLAHAIPALEQALKQNPQLITARKNLIKTSAGLARVLEHSGDLDGANRLWLRIRKEAVHMPESERLFYEIAQAYERAGDWDEARTEYERVIRAMQSQLKNRPELGIRLATAHVRYGDLLHRMGRSVPALEHHRIALTLSREAAALHPQDQYTQRQLAKVRQRVVDLQ